MFVKSARDIYHKGMEEPRITSLDQFLSLWKDIYRSGERPSWDHMMPYYHDDIYFRDSVQEIHGKEEFAEMTRRLTRRSKDLEFLVHSSSMDGHRIFVEWEMVIAYKRYPKSSVYGCSRVLLKDGKVLEQRDYYDLWGDIFRAVGFLSKGYKRFMRRKFG